MILALTATLQPGDEATRDGFDWKPVKNGIGLRAEFYPNWTFRRRPLMVGVYEATIDYQNRTVKVGCQSFTFDTVKELASKL